MSRDEAQDLLQLKVLLLPAEAQVVERQLDHVHPAQRQPTHVLSALVTHAAQVEVEPGAEAGGTTA